jgi:hypothetical protein
LLAAFYDLSASRQIGYNSIGGILLGEVRAYLTFFPQHDEARFLEIMRRLDNEYLAAHRAKRERVKQERASGR